MIDEATLELLSRHLDGDLTPSERTLVEARLAAEPGLAAELAGLERVRDGLRALAARERPPATLDAALEPLRHSAPPAPGLRPAYRWLALAATLLIGATVTFRVAQRAPTTTTDPAPPAREVRAARDTPYPLRPLPTSAVPEDQQLLGAADHLLASPPPTPALPEPPVHTALGPLTEEERQLTAPAESEPRRQREEPGREKARAQARDEEGYGAAASVAGETPRQAVEIARKGEAGLASVDAASTRLGPTAHAESGPREAAPQRTTVTLTTSSGPVVVRLATRVVGGVAERPVLVTVRGGIISAVRAASTNELPPLPEDLVRELTGVALEAVADGEYDATLRVD